MSAIETHLVPYGISVSKVSMRGKEVFGGYFIWFELPMGVSASEVAGMAKEKENLVVAHGNLFEVYGDEEAVRFYRWLRVCFAWEDEDLLIEGIKRLGRVIGDVIRGGSEDGKESEKTVEGLRAPMGEI